MKEVSDHIIRIAVNNSGTKDYIRSLADTASKWISKHWFIFILICIVAPYVAFAIATLAFIIIQNELEEIQDDIAELDNQKETL